MSLLTDYVAGNRRIVLPVAEALLRVVWPYRVPGASTSLEQTGTAVLAAFWPLVEQAHRETGELAREYYDAEREARTGLPPVPFFLAEHKRDWLAEKLAEPLIALHRDPSDARAADLAGAAVREVQAGGRRTIQRGVEADPVALGWARVETGGSSCAFCTLLISRGPVYKDAESAGESNAYHRGCDCRVVPVFDRASFPGRDQYLAAEKEWVKATRAAKQNGTDPINELRKRLQSE
ncbi:hypothetical protein ACL02T_08520 [Pseudonocardia sp. RS010]|uniref:VG15 protein n=1 Tax=Pseudonocardia sp. RS010 TaxID=3385979 RepID=UPI0039A28F65